MIQAGFDNYVTLDSVRAVGQPGSAPITRLVNQAREKGLLVDFTAGRKCKAVIVLDSGQVVLSALTSDTLAKRVRDEKLGRLRGAAADIQIKEAGND
jgi:extracellular matrix regulatory protein A